MSDIVYQLCRWDTWTEMQKNAIAAAAAAEIKRLRDDNLKLRQIIAYMNDHADAPVVVRREARRIAVRGRGNERPR
jgi:hypothetical protein